MNLDNHTLLAIVAKIHDMPDDIEPEGPAINRILDDITSMATEDPREALALDILLQVMYLKGRNGRLPDGVDVILDLPDLIEDSNVGVQYGNHNVQRNFF